MKTKQRLLSLIIIFTMLCSIFPLNAGAFVFNDGVLVSGTDPDTMPVIYADLLDTDGNGNIVLDGGVPKGTSKDALLSALDSTGQPQKFIIGLRLSYFDKFTLTSSNPIRIISTALAYDTNYVTLEPTATTHSVDELFYDRTDIVNNEKAGWAPFAQFQGRNPYYELDTQTKTTEPDNTVPNNLTQTATITQTYKRGTAYTPASGADVYLGFVEFSLNARPSGAAKVIAISTSPTDTAVQFGEDANNAYSYNGSTKLEDYLKLDETQINFFPKSYKVKFFDEESTNFAAATAISEVSVEENTAPTSSQIPADSAFTKSGYFLTGMKYTTNTAADTTNDSVFTPSSPPTITADTYVYGIWEKGRDVIFNSNYQNGGVVANPMPAETTKTVTVNPANTTKFQSTDEPSVGSTGTVDFKVPDHYAFDGWYDAATGGNKIPFDNTKLVSDLDPNYQAYAHWKHKVTVEYYPSKTDAAAGTNKIDSEEVDDSTLYTALNNVPADPTNLDDDTNHKYYNGWKNATGDTVVDFTGAGNVGTGDVFKVYQDWVDYYKVEFYDDEATGSPVLIDTKYVNQRKDTTLPASDIPAGPTAKAPAGKGFGGWVYDASGTPTTFDQTVDVTTAQTGGVLKVYPEWKSKFDVKLYPNDGTTADGLGTPVTHTLLPSQTMGSNYTAPIRTNYILKEWNTQANGSGTSYSLATIASTTFSANTDLYAIWDIDPSVPSADRRTLTFDTVGGSTIAPMVVYKGDKIYQAQMPNNPTKTGPTTTDVYTFIDWFEAATLSNTTIVTRPITMDNDKTIYAHWSYTGANKVTITFNDNGADVKPVSPTTIDIAPGDSIGAAWPTNPEKTDKSFGGWYDGTTAKTSTDTFTTATTLNAKWNDRIKVVYDTNGGNADGPADVEQPATTNYADVTAVPSRTGYQFVGWYTKTNGSGHEIKAGTNPYDTNVTPATLTYGDLVTIPGATVSGTTVTLYARWAAVDPGGETGVPGGTSDPADNAVKVIFDDNVAATSTHTIIKSADPKYMYPQINKALSDVGGLPEAPTRNDYVFKSWNTRADGTGTTFTASDVISATTDSIVANGSKYELTLYAQWEVDPSYSNPVTLTFNKNIDGKGVAGDKYIEYKLAANDVLGFVPTKPSDAAKNDFKFEGWFVSSGPDANGKQQLSTTVTSPDKFDTTTPVAANVTYYAKWRMQLVAVVQPTTINGNPVNGDIYSGTAKHPLYKFYRIPVDKMGSSITQADYISNVYDDGAGTGVDVLGHTDYKAEYTPQGGGTAATTMTDVGKYTIAVSMLDSSPLAISGVEIALTDPALYEILPAQWTVKVDPDTQVEPKTSTIAGPTIQVFDTDGVTPVASTRYEINYYKITGDVNGDNNIDPATDLGPAQTTVPTDIAKYVVSVKPIGTDATNYTIGKVDTTKTGTPAKVYSTTAAALTDPDPSYTSASIGENIYYEIKANDPSANTMTADLTVQPAGSPAPAPVTTSVPFKDNTYATTRTFDNAETPAYSDYYIIVPKTATEVKLNITPKYGSTTVDVAYDDTAAAAQAAGATAATITSGTPVTVGGETVTPKTATIPVDTTKPQTVVAVTMAANGGTPSITYLVTIKTSEAKITLNYGNSPYGEIMRDSTITDKAAAKSAFNTSNRFTSAFTPVGCSTTIRYSLMAWNNSTDANENMDRNDYAIFATNGSSFKDSGFTATDAAGNIVNATDITRTIVFDTLSGRNISEDLSLKPRITVTKTNEPADYTFTDITKAGTVVRPGVYDMVYSFTDSLTNEPVEITRKIVVVSLRGDSNLDGTVNGTDQQAIINRVGGTPLWNTSVIPGQSGRLYEFRSVDTNMDGTVNGTDQQTIINRVGGTLIIPFYNDIK